MSTTTTPAAGWYPHPTIEGMEGYWDGTQWQPAMVRTVPTHHVGPMTARSLNVKREVVYNRQQKGHSVILAIFITGPLTAFILPIYWSVSPNHYWHA